MEQGTQTQSGGVIKLGQRGDSSVVITSFVAHPQLGAADDVRGCDPSMHAKRHISIAHGQVVDDGGDGFRGQEELLSLIEPIGSFVLRTVQGCFHFELFYCQFKLFPSAGVTDLGR